MLLLKSSILRGGRTSLTQTAGPLQDGVYHLPQLFSSLCDSSVSMGFRKGTILIAEAEMKSLRPRYVLSFWFLDKKTQVQTNKQKNQAVLCCSVLAQNGKPGNGSLFIFFVSIREGKYRSIFSFIWAGSARQNKATALAGVALYNLPTHASIPNWRELCTPVQGLLGKRRYWAREILYIYTAARNAGGQDWMKWMIVKFYFVINTFCGAIFRPTFNSCWGDKETPKVASSSLRFQSIVPVGPK